MSFWEYVVWFLQHLYVLVGAMSIAYIVVSYLCISSLYPYRNILTGPILDWDRYLYIELDILFLVDFVIRGTKQIRFPFTEDPGSVIVPLWSACFVLLAISFLIKLGFLTYLTIQGFKIRNKNRLAKRPKKVKGEVSND